MTKDYIQIRGAGGGSKPKKQRPPIEAPNTLQSAAKGKILDLLGYGPIYGLEDGLKSVLLDDTPILNDDGSGNFAGVTVEMRHGEPAQDIISGFAEISNPREINTEVLFSTPIVRTLLNNDSDAVLVTFRLPALVETDINSGDSNPYTVPVAVYVKSGTGEWNTGVADIIKGKNTAPYERTYRIELHGGGPYTIRVERGNKESTVSSIRDSVYWSYLTEVTDIRQNYPSCALAGITIDAKLFGNSLPSRKYKLKLSIINVPSNYNPETRQYTGIWDGQFIKAWTDNPAWCFYDLATHPIIGAGLPEVNKWSLYEIGKYCDELVPDGYGGMEPRFTCNTIFSAQEDAITALSTLASVFRGMMYWGAGTIETVADMPGPIRRNLGPAEVIGGEFSYEGTSLRERHSVAIVMWNDPDDGYVSKPEMIEDPESIELLGWRELRITAVACTSRGQARRVGLWALYSEKHETQTVSFSVPVKHFDVRPGEFIQISDPYRAGARLSGRIAAVANRRFTLDQAPSGVTTSWHITLETSNGLERLPISLVQGNVITTSREPAFPVVVGASFALSSADVVPQIFRIVAATEKEGSVFNVTATEHRPNKYQEIEYGLVVPDTPTTLLPTGRLRAPTNLTAAPYTYFAGGSSHQGLTIGWTSPQDPRIETFLLDVKGPNDVAFRTVYNDIGVSYDLPDTMAGEWHLRVRSVSLEFGHSEWTTAVVQTDNMLKALPPDSLHFQATSNSISIMPAHQQFNPQWEFWRSAVPLESQFIEGNALFLGTGSFFVDVPLHWGTTYYYYVRGFNIYGKSAWVAGQATTEANVDDILDIILKDEQDSPLGQWFQEEIGKISGDSEGSVNERITKADARISGIIAGVEDNSEELRQELDILNNQLYQLLGAPEFDFDQEYLADTVVQLDGTLYQARQNVPAGTAPPNEEYWAVIGDFTFIADAVANLALRVERAETSVERINGIVTPISSAITSLQATVGTLYDEEDGYLEGALRQWDSAAEFTQETRVWATQWEAFAQRLTILSAEVGDSAAKISTLERVVATNEAATALKIEEMRAELSEDINSKIYTERLARVNTDEALAREINQLEVNFGEELNAQILQESIVRADADEALASTIEDLTAHFNTETDNLSARILQESTTRASEDEALATQFTLVAAELEQEFDVKLAAAVSEETTARVSADEALASQITTVSADVTLRNRVFRGATPPNIVEHKIIVGDMWYNLDNLPHRWNGSVWEQVGDKRITTLGAAIQSETVARVSQDQALARRIDTTQASVGNLSTSVQSISQAQASADGKMNALWGVKLQMNSNGQYVTAGIGIGMSNAGGIVQSNFICQVDRFSIIQGINGAQIVPFAIQSGQTIIKDALIGNAAITTAKIRNAAVETITIGGHAVTVPAVAGAGFNQSPVASVTLNQPGAITVTGVLTLISTVLTLGLSLHIQELVGGIWVFRSAFGQKIYGDSTSSHPVVGLFTRGIGTHTFRLFVTDHRDISVSRMTQVESSTIQIQGAKR